MIGQPEWADDRGLDSVVGRTERCEELNPVIRAWTTERTTADIVELATLMRIPCIEVGNGETIPQMDHFMEAGFYDTNPDGGFLQPAPPFRMHPPIPGVGERPPGAGRRSGDQRRRPPDPPAPSGARRRRPAPGRSRACGSPTSRRSGPGRSSPTRSGCSAPTSSTSSRRSGPTAPG